MPLSQHGQPGGDEQVGNPGRVQEADDLGVGRRAEPLEDPEHVVLEDQLVDDVDRDGRVVGVVLDDQVDLAPVHATVGVDVVEERLGGGRDLAVARRGRTGERLMRPERDAGRGHAGRGGAAVAALLLLLLVELLAAAAAGYCCSTTRRPRAPTRPPRDSHGRQQFGPAKAHTSPPPQVDPTGTARTSTRGI